MLERVTPQFRELQEITMKTDTRDILAHATKQAESYEDYFLVDIDAHRTGGMLELVFPNRSVIVVNTQPPLHELWLAARSGGHHYKHVAGRWLDTRDGRDFFEALSAAASEQAMVRVVIEILCS